MTIKQMINAVNTANMVADVAPSDHFALVFEDKDFFTMRKEINTYREACKHIRDCYIKEIADQIINYKDYEFETDAVFANDLDCGDLTINDRTTVCFDIFRKRNW